MMDAVVPGGVARDLADAATAELRGLIRDLWQRAAALLSIYDTTPSLQDRTVGTGIVTAALAAQYAAGGFVGRASGRKFDARQLRSWPLHDQLRLEVPVLKAGDVNARLWVRATELQRSFDLVEQILTLLPSGPIHAPAPSSPGEGLALVEGFRGDVLAWVRLDQGRIARCHLRDPSWFQWPLLEAAIEGNIVADFPLCNKSFNCSYSGHDL
jgi:Ni,Fe-hydrogenase III large subunit